jgi:hypothetical protein
MGIFFSGGEIVMVQFKWFATVTASTVNARIKVRTLPLEGWSFVGEVTLLHCEWHVLANSLNDSHTIVIKDPSGFLL